MDNPHALSAFECAEMQIELAQAKERIKNLENAKAALENDKNYWWDKYEETAAELERILVIAKPHMCRHNIELSYCDECSN